MGYFAKTRVFKVDPDNPDHEIISLVSRLLVAGKLVAFPTETVYGLGANAFDSTAIGHIFEAKERPSSDPIIVHINELNQVYKVAIHVPDITWMLAEKFWPGPLTLILERNSKIPESVSAGLNTVAVRMPNHQIPRRLIECSGVPIAAPSANLFTRPSPTTAQHVYTDLKNRVDVILDGGPCAIGLESTVLDLTGEVPVLLRPGGCSIESLRHVIPSIRFKPNYLSMGKDITPIGSPGMLLKHYSPRAKLLLFTGNHAKAIKKMVHVSRELISESISVGVMVSDEDERHFDGISVKMKLLGSHENLTQISHNLFAGMRELDENGVDVILVNEYSREGLGLAIWDRLVRASEGLIINSPIQEHLTIKIKDYALTISS